jgi:hypothetical protein
MRASPSSWKCGHVELGGDALVAGSSAVANGFTVVEPEYPGRKPATVSAKCVLVLAPVESMGPNKVLGAAGENGDALAPVEG